MDSYYDSSSSSLPNRPFHHLYTYDNPLTPYRPAQVYSSPLPSPSDPGTPQYPTSSTIPRGYPTIQPPKRFNSHALGQNGYKVLEEEHDYYGYNTVSRYSAGMGRNVGMGRKEMDPFFVPALPVNDGKEESPKKAGKKARKLSESKQPTFLTKLYGILEQPETQHIIRWDIDGEMIIIEKPLELANKILPIVYRQGKFASFSRQLNIYGFMRKVSLRHVEEGIEDPDASTWAHAHLHRLSPLSEVLNFKRRVGPRPSQSKRRSIVSNSNSIPDIIQRPSSPLGPDSEYEFSDPDDAYHTHLLGEGEDKKPTLSELHYPMMVGAGSSVSPPELGVSRSSDGTGGYAVSPDSDNYPSPPYPLHQYSHPTQPTFQIRQPNFGTSTLTQPNFGPSIYDNHMGSAPLYTPYYPQSAPLLSTGGLNGDFQVYQGHFRTRSVQGDPPSATFWSPSSYPGSHGTASAFLYGTDGLISSSAGGFGSASTEGWVNCYTNEPMAPPLSSLGMAGASLAAVAQAVPTFSSGAGAGIGEYSPTTTANIDIPTSTNNARQGLGEAFQYRSTPPSSQSRHTLSSSFDSVYPPTISPGLYRPGFKPPISLTRSISSPRPTPTPLLSSSPNSLTQHRQERRQSISSTPYSPRQRQLLSLNQLSMSPPRGPYRGVGDGYKSSTSTMGTPEMIIPELPVGIVEAGEEEEEEELPSAGMKGFLKGVGEEGPFVGGFLGIGKGELTDNED